MIGVTFPPQPLSLITEFAEGGGLLEYLRNSQGVDLGQKKKFISGIALGMNHLSLEKIVHRDLAVRNILLTKHLEPKVSDFGLSRENTPEDGAAVTQSNIGPLKWMSPEAVMSRSYSTKSDVYAFGIVIWEILTVEEPYAEMGPMEAALQVVNNGLRPPIPEGTDPLLVSLMTREFFHPFQNVLLTV